MSIKIVSVRDGFKDEDGVWREKWQIATVSDHYAQAIIARERTVFSTASLKDQIAKGLPQITVRNFCRALKLSLEGDIIAWRERAITAIIKLEAAEDARLAKLAEDAAAPAGEDEEKKDQSTDHADAEGSSTPPETEHAAAGDGADVAGEDDELADAPAEDAAAPAEKHAKKPRKAK